MTLMLPISGPIADVAGVFYAWLAYSGHENKYRKSFKWNSQVEAQEHGYMVENLDNRCTKVSIRCKFRCLVVLWIKGNFAVQAKWERYWNGFQEIWVRHESSRESSNAKVERECYEDIELKIGVFGRRVMWLTGVAGVFWLMFELRIIVVAGSVLWQ